MTLNVLRRKACLLAGLVSTAAVVLSPSVAAAAAPPLITQTSFSSVSETGATLSASVDPTGGKTNAHFQYTLLAEFKAHGFVGAEAAPVEEIVVPSQVKGVGTLTSGSEFITAASTLAGAFGLGETITAGTAIPAETKIVALEKEAGKETLKLQLSKSPTETISAANLIATGPQPIAASLSGLSPASGYVFRALTKKVAGAQEEAQGSPVTFYTYGPVPSFPTCPNDDLRSGALAPLGAPGALLPDCRSFELASPLEKNGNDVAGSLGFLRAADDGSAITFGSTFAIPGGDGAQAPPFYQAVRGDDDWSTSGLQPPAATGQLAHVLVGQLPDLSATYAIAEHPGDPYRTALFEIHRDGRPPIQITPYADGTPEGNFAFAGASTDASTLVIEAPFALPENGSGPTLPGSVPGAPNVYVWDRASGTLHLASAMNTLDETEATLSKGAYAGPYDWTSENLARTGGAGGGYYVTDEHAVATDGSVIFTSRSNGHLYQRLNPTQPQSAVIHAGEPNEECTEAAKACTIDLSASKRTPPDSAGEQPAAFQVASPDGSTVVFTSSEELTNESNTGPEQPPAQIGRATLHGEEPAGQINEGFLSIHALGLAVDPKGEYIYWADPSKWNIGRAKLDASGDLVPGSTESNFIEPGEGECPEVVKDAEIASGDIEVPPVFDVMRIPSKPHYIAVDEDHIYWTNSGREGNEGPLVGGGSIGRAKLKPDHSGVEGEPEPTFICGAAPNRVNPNTYAERLVSNPQGIAVNDEFVFWSNSTSFPAGGTKGIARAAIDGSNAETFVSNQEGGAIPRGIALAESSIYLGIEQGAGSYVERFSLSSPTDPPKFLITPSNGIRSMTISAGYLYWASPGSESVSREKLTGFQRECEAPACTPNFVTPAGVLDGLASDGSHLFWSVNGESPKNPGADLYRFQHGAAQPLTDLTPDSADPNGAEVQGVIGTSADGSYVYFVANAVLDDAKEAKLGDCHGQLGNGLSSTMHGECSIYLAHDGAIDYVARARTEVDNRTSDGTNWTPKAYYTIGLQNTARVSPDGSSLIFRSQLPQTSTDNHGVIEYYRYSPGGGVSCLTCDPSGLPGGGETLGSLQFSYFEPGDANLGATQVRFASSDGSRFFFETTAALVSYDTDGVGGCPSVGSTFNARPSCQDIYEWEAPGIGSCTVGGPGYSPLNQGCLYLISQNTDSGPAFFAGVSASGNDVFFVTNSRLVGRDSDDLRDVYDARALGGLASQNIVSLPPCEGEGCKATPTQPPSYQSPPSFFGPANPKPKRCKGMRCHKKHTHHKHRKHNHKRRAAK